MNSSNNILNLEKTKQNLNLLRLLSDDYSKGSWQGRVILEIRYEGNTVFLQTSKITGWKAILLDKIKTFFGISQNSHLPAVVEFIRKHMISLNAESINIINSKIANHNAKKINRFFKRMIPTLVHQHVFITPTPTPEILSTKDTIQRIKKTISANENNFQEAAVFLCKCFNQIAKTLKKEYGYSEANAFLSTLEGKDDLEKAKAIREWMISSSELLGKITVLNLEGLELASLPNEIAQLQNLKYLYLNNNLLTSLPKAIGQLKKLTKISLEHNKLTTLPAEIGQLQNITELNLQHNQLTCLPAEIGQLQSLTELYLDNNQLSNLPAEIGQLQNLGSLNLQQNQLTSLPVEIGQLKNLPAIFLQHNQLTSLPTEIGKLTKLVALYLGGNKLLSLPAEIGQLKKLESLSVEHNQLISLPSEFGQLPKLYYFRLEQNPFTSFPDEIIKSSNPKIAQNTVIIALQRIKKKNVRANVNPKDAALSLCKCFDLIAKSLHYDYGHSEAHVFLSTLEGKDDLEKAKAIREWMDSFSELLEKITYLNLTGLKLITLPAEIGKLQNLSILNLENNPLTSLPDEIVNSCNPNIAQNKVVLAFSKKNLKE